MSGGAFDRGHWRLGVAEDTVDDPAFSLVVEVGPGAMGVDVLDVARLQLGVLQGEPDGALRTVSLGMRCGDVVGVGGRGAELPS